MCVTAPRPATRQHSQTPGPGTQRHREGQEDISISHRLFWGSVSRYDEPKRAVGKGEATAGGQTLSFCRGFRVRTKEGEPW